MSSPLITHLHLLLRIHVLTRAHHSTASDGDGTEETANGTDRETADSNGTTTVVSEVSLLATRQTYGAVVKVVATLPAISGYEETLTKQIPLNCECWMR